MELISQPPKTSGSSTTRNHLNTAAKMDNSSTWPTLPGTLQDSETEDSHAPNSIRGPRVSDILMQARAVRPSRNCIAPVSLSYNRKRAQKEQGNLNSFRNSSQTEDFPPLPKALSLHPGVPCSKTAFSNPEPSINSAVGSVPWSCLSGHSPPIASTNAHDAWQGLRSLLTNQAPKMKHRNNVMQSTAHNQRGSSTQGCCEYPELVSGHNCTALGNVSGSIIISNKSTNTSRQHKYLKTWNYIRKKIGMEAADNIQVVFERFRQNEINARDCFASIGRYLRILADGSEPPKLVPKELKQTLDVVLESMLPNDTCKQDQIRTCLRGSMEACSELSAAGLQPMTRRRDFI
mmetsp:Transcript_42806/g.114564  ORF Transcript_42806/g.114564 Transcript_42806/m.114564 type:complete len:347 (-) Transcript_42806:47-1087(-)